MPNPLMTRYQKNQSATQVDDPDEPVIEHYAGQNFPYRGIETHGVDPAFTPKPPPGHEDDTVKVKYEEPEVIPEPIPVRIVDADTREQKAWGTGHEVLAERKGYLIAGMDLRRTKLTIVNQGPDTVYISPDSGVSPVTGFPIAINATLVIEAETPVWGTVDAGDTATLKTVWEYTKKL